MPGGIRLEIQAALGEDGAVLAEREGGRSPSIRRPRPPNLRLTTSRRPIFHHPLNLARSAPRTAAARTMSLDGADASTGRGILIGMLSAFASAAIVAVVCAVVYFFRYTRRGRILLDRIGAPGEFDDEQAFAREEAQALAQMDDLQRIEYSRAKAFVEANPPESMATDISLSQFLAIQEKGVSAWEFEPELEIANCFVEARTEIEFFDSACSVQSNLPVPKQNEVYYWEAKIYDKPDATLVSIGMATKPYPLFRLPGWHRHSVAYTSTGHRRYNQPFTATTYGPVILQGDVIGVGYRPRTGTVFFTRNGKKLDDVAHALRTQNLFPTVGANGPATVHVNFGQSGFVYIEANVKKWGLAPMTGSLAPPPPYGSEQGSILLEAAGRDGGAGEAGVAGVTNAWRSGHGHTGAGAGYGHGRSRSGPASSGPMPGSPGPVRSPTEISLAQLIHFADDVHDDVGEAVAPPFRLLLLLLVVLITTSVSISVRVWVWVSMHRSRPRRITAVRPLPTAPTIIVMMDARLRQVPVITTTTVLLILGWWCVCRTRRVRPCRAMRLPRDIVDGRDGGSLTSMRMGGMADRVTQAAPRHYNSYHHS
ncbi:MAG: Rsp5p-dependent ubiquitination, sorting of cargo proteins at the multivesicular body [Phylliscum demangeonii]|nr:MAG: Rsp5p-dependent ubiquitination, sorting of cargo proteins at the multivesicular body [Phylliscum demangeonii]